MTVRLVQIGLGGWGRSWIEEVTRSVPGVEPVAYVDSDPQARALAQKHLGLAPPVLFETLAQAVEATSPDAALIVVPLAVHGEVTREAIDLGLHALVEKPFTEALAEARELCRRAEAANVQLIVNQNYRWFPAPRLARQMIENDEIGLPAAISVDFARLFDEAYRYFFLAEPLLSDMAIHHFDLMRFVLDDEPVEASCMSWTEEATPFIGRPAAVATIRFARGTIVSYRGSWICRGPMTNFGGDWRIDGKKGSLSFTFRGGGKDRIGQDRLVHYAEAAVPAERELAPMRHLDRAGSLASFAAGIAHGKPEPMSSTARDNIGSLGLMHTLIRSAELGGRLLSVREVLEETRR